MQQRLKRHPFVGLFDGADANVSTARRELTTVPTQALYLMNNEFVHQRAEGLARRALAESPDAAGRVEFIWRTAFGRAPGRAEQADAAAFAKQYTDALAGTGASPDSSEVKVWSALARTVVTRNEFLFVD